MKDLRIHALIVTPEASDRLWPLSRNKTPKQLLPFIKDASLLEQTIDLVGTFIDQKRRWIVTRQEEAEDIESSVGEKVEHIVVEPEKCSQFSAMLLAAFLLEEIDPHATLLFLPADYYIPEKKKFLEFIEYALDYAQEHETITMLGFKPSYASTEYQYIVPAVSDEYPSRITTLHTDPTQEEAEKYLQAGYLWNSGICVAQVKSFLSICQEAAPDIFDSVLHFVHSSGTYNNTTQESFGSAVICKSDKISVLPVDFIWSDVSNLETFLALKNTQQQKASIIEVDAKNNVVEAQDALVALVGVEDLCVVQKDDIILVVHRDHVEKVKQVVDILKHNQQEEYL